MVQQAVTSQCCPRPMIYKIQEPGTLECSCTLTINNLNIDFGTNVDFRDCSWPCAASLRHMGVMASQITDHSTVTVFRKKDQLFDKPFYHYYDVIMCISQLGHWFGQWYCRTNLSPKHHTKTKYERNLWRKSIWRCLSSIKFQLLVRSQDAKDSYTMMTSSNGNIFRVTGPLCGEFTGHRWIPLKKANDAALWCFLWSASE